jgi:hypothetical protein
MAVSEIDSVEVSDDNHDVTIRNIYKAVVLLQVTRWEKINHT